MARNSRSSLHGNSPKSTSAKRLLSQQGNSISKKPRLSSTLKNITAQNNDDTLSLDTSAVLNNKSSLTTQQGNQNNNKGQENNINNTLPSNSNEPVEENNMNNTHP
eukprot:9310261-Ditylum_brightwellii.AAC.1